MGKILIKDIYLEGKQVSVLVDGEKISRIADRIDIDSITDLTKIIDGRGKAIIPGFANMHTHAAMTVMRGSKEDEKLHKWLAGIWEMETRLDDEIVYWGTKLACLEMIKTGTTFFNDQYFNVPSAVQATYEMGLRGAHSFVFLDLGDKSEGKLPDDVRKVQALEPAQHIRSRHSLDLYCRGRQHRLGLQVRQGA